jgi:hypothetical protein
LCYHGGGISSSAVINTVIVTVHDTTITPLSPKTMFSYGGDYESYTTELLKITDNKMFLYRWGTHTDYYVCVVTKDNNNNLTLGPWVAGNILPLNHFVVNENLVVGMGNAPSYLLYFNI